MSITVPLFGTMPNSATMTESAYNAAWDSMLGKMDTYGVALNALGAEVEENAANAEAAVASLASAVWVSGTTYAIGNVRYSPVDFLNYRRRTNGAGTTDPSNDQTNWVLLTKTGSGGADTTTSAVDITLTSTSGRLQIIAMTASGKKTNLPAASTLNKGAPIFVIKNAGTYRFAVHKNGGGFLCYVLPGQVVALHCSDISTGPGIWHVSGNDIDQIYGGNTAEVLNAVNSTYISAAMLSATQAICAFKNNSTTYLNVLVLNYGSASGSPVPVNAEASFDISIAAQTSSQATVIYKTSSGVTKGYVIDITGNTPAPGAVATIDATAGGSGTALTALSSTQLLCLYQNASAGTPRERVLDISASAITPSSEVVADATTSASVYYKVKKISASKALVAFRDSSSNALKIRLQTIAGSTPAPAGSVTATGAPGTSYGSIFDLVILSAARALLIHSVDRTYADLMISLFDISGSSSPVLLRNKLLRVGLVSSADIYASKLDANTVYATWTGGGSGGVDAIVIKITDDDQIIGGAVADKLEPGVTVSSGYLSCDALDASHVMQVCRNSSTYLSAKTIEVVS